MKLKYEFVINEVADRIMAVAVNAEEFKGMLRLNKTGAFIFDMLKNDVTEDEIVAAMLEKYDATEEKLRETVEKFVETLQNAGVITED